MTEARRSTPPPQGARTAFLPNDIDPTVFDEAFLRQLERLLLLLRSPVRGGLKGGRRSVKRGQSVEFADYRDYAIGDDLRQLDWNVFARLEKLFVKLFVEEEDVTITLLIDASASMASGEPEKLLFAKRAAAALGYIGLASEDRVASVRSGGRASRRHTAAPRLRPGVPAPVEPLVDPAGRRPDRPRGRSPPRRRPAPRSGRHRPHLGPPRPGRRSGHPRARGDPLRADHPAHPLARRARSAARRRPPARRYRDRRAASTSPPTSRRSMPTATASRRGRSRSRDLAARRRARATSTSRPTCRSTT